MANPSARRLAPDQAATATVGRAGGQSTEAGSAGANSAAPGGSPGSAPTGSQNAAAPANSKAHYRSHQRRQSVARLLPDISKLRLLSWLVEASSELINCDIAIMDGVYAKLNRSQESLLFWSQGNSSGAAAAAAAVAAASSQQQQATTNGKPAVPASQPVANRILISQTKAQKARPRPQSQMQQQQQQQSGKKSQQQAKQRHGSGRNHHSLPLTNYDASSLAAVSLSASLGAPGRSSGRRAAFATGDSDSIVSSSSQPASVQQRLQQPVAAAANSIGCSADLPPVTTGGEYVLTNLCDSSSMEHSPAQQNSVGANNNEDSCDSNQSDDDDNSSAASSTTSSGIHGGTSISSSASSTAGSSSSAASSLSSEPATRAPRQQTKAKAPPAAAAAAAAATRAYASSAEQLSEKLRRIVIEHNYLQSLLVNVIRQHDKQRDLANQQHQFNLSPQMLRQQSQLNNFNRQQQQQQRIDLAEIAEALDDGCLCMCHSQHSPSGRSSSQVTASTCDQAEPSDGGNSSPARSSTLPAAAAAAASANNVTPASGGSPQVPARPKVRRLKKIRGSNNSSSNSELNRQDIINLMADKLCENCFETHYWLHGCSIELMQPKTTTRQQEHSGSFSSELQLHQQQQDLNGIIAKRNATFIKLVQQEVRSAISKSIELIDLIRKEIKSPESIKQKQLMRCFSTSIQLLTSVGNYVVPAQDISSFIPEVGQQQTTLFCLPSSDFDHLLLYHHHQHPSNQHLLQQQQANSNYHLASAPDIPIRRLHKFPLNGQTSNISGGGSLPISIRGGKGRLNEHHLLSSNLQRLKTSDSITSNAAVDSSSGASSNNSSASSSIARGQVQKSSLTRAQTASVLLEGKTSHDLSFEMIATLSSQTEDDSTFQARPKFWQSSKFNFIKKLLHVKQQRLLRQQSKDRRIYNNKVQNKFRLVMMDLTHFNKSQQLLTTENGVNSLLTSMRNVLEFGLYLTLKLY